MRKKASLAGLELSESLSKDTYFCEVMSSEFILAFVFVGDPRCCIVSEAPSTRNTWHYRPRSSLLYGVDTAITPSAGLCTGIRHSETTW
jgi:hypothetical protein